ncbi:MAG TPA: cytochrome c biogenesis protein CcdA [Myxococcales bacterium]|nr:cytochrome c biogenesis protein CcdA [Myxococcales bacterium]
MPKKVLLLALVAAALVVVIPWIVPTGPDASLDASQFLASGQFALAAGVVFLGGLLTAMTPCVYPLIPITVSVFGARKDTGRGKALALSTSYILGMAAVFCALGVLAAKTGAAFGSLLGKPAVSIGLAVFLGVLASSMFGAFELALPSSVQTKLNSVGGAGVPGAFLMGSVSGFLAAPCTGPVLTSLLAFVARSQSTALGAGLLFIYALGVGAPFFVIGVFAVKLPRGGVWMEWVKSVLGVALVALAVSYLRDGLAPLREAFGALAAQLGRAPGTAIAAAAAAVGVLVGAVHRSFKGGAKEAVLKGIGVAAVAVALLVRVGALNSPGPGDLWVGLGLAEKLPPSAVTWTAKLDHKGDLVGSVDTVLARARTQGKPVMIDFFAEWCAACKELDRDVYVAPSVVEEADRFVSIKVDGTEEADSITQLYERFGVQGLPTVAFVSSHGEMLSDPRITGYLEPDRFLAELKKVR